ncbi:hypothetical protein FIU95_08150 [Microbulbifer sp. THAF38]|nr:hypothetical protein FIU95_08150 [Microbulbifer sp. THAF38]
MTDLNAAIEVVGKLYFRKKDRPGISYLDFSMLDLP